MNNSVTYRGDQQTHPKTSHSDTPLSEPYVATPELINAVNLAIFLNRPLLLEGDAGCGKTRLAYSVAYELGWPLYRWDIRSTSKAQDGLYYYDALMRLHDVQLQRVDSNSPRQPSIPTDYRTFGAIGKAFQLKESPAVVLIDEIDKADIDFPNDLLTILDDPWSFDIQETKEKIAASHKPLVIITSNGEKGSLPSPFLRRCIYYYLVFPEQIDFEKIVAAHYPDTAPSKKLVNNAIKRFFTLREDTNLHKQPGTSEFLDWLKALHHFPLKLTEDDSQLPYPSLLLKVREDWLQYVS